MASGVVNFFQAGILARRRNVNRIDVPAEIGVALRNAWLAGWDTEQRFSERLGAKAYAEYQKTWELIYGDIPEGD